MDSIDYLIIIENKQVTFLVENNIEPNICILPINIYLKLRSLSTIPLVPAELSKNKKDMLLGLEIIVSSDLCDIKVGRLI